MDNLEEDICSGYRTGDVEVTNKKDEIVFEGPSSNQIQEMMESLIEYFNGVDNTCEIHESDVTYFIDFYTKLVIDTISEIRKNYLQRFSKKIIS